jgi:hypothetical protein
MVMKAYIDGCSMTYGQGLPRDQTLSHLFSTVGGYKVLDKSSPGKSNIAICFDAYQHRQDFDVFILGFTYSSRFGLKYHDHDLKFFSGHHSKGFGLDLDELDHAHLQVQKYFYTIFGPPYCDQLSDMLIDTMISFLKKDKIVLGFSWEKRNTSFDLFYPYVSPTDRLSDGHLNQQGTIKLFHNLQNLLNV